MIYKLEQKRFEFHFLSITAAIERYIYRKI